MKIITLITALLAAAFLTGCVNVPETKVVGSVAGKPFALVFPKDLTAVNLSINVQTNGAFSLCASNLQTRMNPDVITTTGAAQKALVDSIFAGIVNVVQSAPK